MIIPCGDITPRKTFPFINYLFIAANVLVFFYEMTAPKPQEVVETYALYPDRWTWMTVMTSMFMHADIWHLFGNMLFLWIAGDNVEDRIGHVGYVVFYLAAGVAGSIAHIMTVTGDGGSIPTVGASGAISGVIGAYLVYFPKSQIKFLVLPFMKTITSPSWFSIGLWIATQALLLKATLDGKGGRIAVFAHAGGFVLGFSYALLHRLFFSSKKSS